MGSWREAPVTLYVLCVILAKFLVLPAKIRGIQEDALLTPPSLIRKYGYPVEVHSVQTEDGYILEMHRIPYGVRSGAAPNKMAVIVQHGNLGSSALWVMTGPVKGLGFILADQGYDVWLGNARGNTFSRKHVTLSPSKAAFWQFSFHEMGVYDLPAMIDHVLNNTGQEKLFYIGYSQGTTQFYVMAADRPEYNSKIKAMISLAPSAFLKNMFNPFVQVFAPLTQIIEMVLDGLGIHEFLPNSPLYAIISQVFCSDGAITQILCKNSLFLAGGYNERQLNGTTMPVFAGHNPGGTSVKTLLHYSQLVVSGAFRKYDFRRGNFARYGQNQPPNYDLSKITCPVVFFYGRNDWFLSPKDVTKLYKLLPNKKGIFPVSDKEFTHFDFVWANNVKTVVYDKVIEQMRAIT